MTTVEALKASVGYPIADKYLERVLLDRGIRSNDLYEGLTPSFMLAKADIYALMVVSPNISEGDVNLVIQDRSMFMELANTIYKRYGDPGEILTDAKNTFRDRSDIW